MNTEIKELEDHNLIIRLIDETELEFESDTTWQLDRNSLCIFMDNGTFLIGEFPRESIVGIWRQVYSEEQK